MNGISALIKGTPESPLSLSAKGGGKAGHLQIQKRALTGI